MSHGGSEPAVLHGLRKQVTEAKEGPLELRRRTSEETPKGGRHGQGRGVRGVGQRRSHSFSFLTDVCRISL